MTDTDIELAQNMADAIDAMLEALDDKFAEPERVWPVQIYAMRESLIMWNKHRDECNAIDEVEQGWDKPESY